jgi:hypothetical protein
MSSPEPMKLDYCPAPPAQESPARTALVIVFAALLTLAHLGYTHAGALYLWKLSGGIQKQGRWTSYGDRDWAWTVPVHVPGGAVFYAGIKSRGVDGFRHYAKLEVAIGLLLLLLGSIAAGERLASLVAAILWRDRPIMGRYGWRLWWILLGWGWIPVPAAMSWIFQWTVIY